ncbi:MAG: hypothetical protein H7Y15_18535 [Pseudonocardia sp.]|nr:hypothetical protein [Pseudonocardia sp.]
MITVAESVEARARIDVTHLVCGGRCPAVTHSRDLVEGLVDDNGSKHYRVLAAAHWQEAWRAAQRAQVWLPWSDDAPPDERPRCAVVPLFVELQRIWTAALFCEVGMAYDWMAPDARPAPFGSEQDCAQQRLLTALTDTDQRSSRAVQIMGYWTRLALTGHWATVTMDRHRLAGTMHVPYLNGMVRITRRAAPRAFAYEGRRRGHVLPDRFVGLVPR